MRQVPAKMRAGFGAVREVQARTAVLLEWDDSYCLRSLNPEATTSACPGTADLERHRAGRKQLIFNINARRNGAQNCQRNNVR